MAKWCEREKSIAAAVRRAASWREATKNEEGGGPFRACGNSFVRETRGDGIYDDEERETIDRPVGRMNERRREAQVRRRASGRIEKEVNGGLADGEEREREREINVSGEERERERVG